MDRIDGLITHIKRQVRLREQRRRAGAGERELAQRSAEIRRLQTQLAYAVRDRLHADGRLVAPRRSTSPTAEPRADLAGVVLAGPRHALPEHSSQARR